MVAILTARLWVYRSCRGSTIAASRRTPAAAPAGDGRRGIIVDRNGKVLVRQHPGFAVSVVPVDLPKERANRSSLARQLVGRDPNEALKAVADQRARNP